MISGMAFCNDHSRGAQNTRRMYLDLTLCKNYGCIVFLIGSDIGEDFTYENVSQVIRTFNYLLRFSSFTQVALPLA